MSSGEIIAEPQSVNVYEAVKRIRVETKSNWTDLEWDEIEVIPISMEMASAHQGGMSKFVFHRPYGRIKLPSESVISDLDYMPNEQDWVRVLKDPFDVTEDILFLGRISNDTRDVHGNVESTGLPPSGMQKFTCYGGDTQLFKRNFFQTVYAKDLEAVEKIDQIGLVGRLIPANTWDGTDWMPNRSTSKITSEIDHYVFDNTGDKWTSRDLLEYFIDEFMHGHNQSGVTFGVDKPKWTLSGQLEDLNNLVQYITFQETESVYSVLKKIIPASKGWDFVVRPKEDGYDIKVFTINADAVTYKTQTIPANPTTHSIDLSGTVRSRKITVDRSHAQCFGRIEIVANPTVTCGTFRTAAAGGTTDRLETTFDPTSGAFVAYETTDIIGDVELADDVRRLDRFQHLFQQLVVPIENDQSTMSGGILPSWDESILTYRDNPKGFLHDGPRETLSWTPMYDTFDYSVDPPVDESKSSLHVQPSFVPPGVWCWNINTNRYSQVEYFDVGVQPMRNQLGVQLRAPLPHLLAGTIIDPPLTNSNVETVLDIENSIVTLAFELDERVRLTEEIPNNSQADGVWIEQVDVNFWIIAPETTLGFDSETAMEIKTKNDFIVVRNEMADLEMAMAGAKARYQSGRSHASFQIAGILRWIDLVGDILNAINDGTDADEIKAPITKLTWSFDGDHETKVQTGHAVR